MIKNISVVSFILLLAFLGVIKPVSATDNEITLENITSTISAHCSKPHQPRFRSESDYKCTRKYVIELISNDNLFENYNRLSHLKKVVIQTSLHEIRPEVELVDRSRLRLYITEEQLEKMFQSKDAKFEFNNNLFGQTFLQKKLDLIDDRNYARSFEEGRKECLTNPRYQSDIPGVERSFREQCIDNLKARKHFRYPILTSTRVESLKLSSTLNLNTLPVNRLKDSCSYEHTQCLKELDTLNSPVNRLKRYFSQ